MNVGTPRSGTASIVLEVVRSRRATKKKPVNPQLVAVEAKATNRPSAEIAGIMARPLDFSVTMLTGLKPTETS